MADREIETLGEARDMWAALMGEQDGGTKFLDAKIAEQGRDERLVCHSSQLLLALAEISRRGYAGKEVTNG